MDNQRISKEGYSLCHIQKTDAYSPNIIIDDGIKEIYKLAIIIRQCLVPIGEDEK